VRVRGAEDAFVAMGLGKPELSGPRDATWRAEELRSWCDAEGSFRLFEVIDEVGIRVAQKRTVGEVVIAYLVSGGFDARNQVGMAEGALANQEESCLGIVLVENVEDLGREDRVRAVIKGEGNEGAAGANTIGEIWRESL
jgi:hypothetical protein